MSALTWFTIAIVGFSLSGIMLIVAVILFFTLKIPAVIGDLSGKTAAREIQAIKESESSGAPKAHKIRKASSTSEKLQAKPTVSPEDARAMALAHSSKRLDKQHGAPPGARPGTEPMQPETTPINGAAGASTMPMPPEPATSVLGINQPTEDLSHAATSSLDSQPVAAAYSGTTVLDVGDEKNTADITPVNFRIIKNLTLIHTKETIQ